MDKFILEIHTIEKTVFKDEAFSVSVPTAKKEELTVLHNHIPLITSLGAGTLRYQDVKGEQFLFISGGFMEVQNKRVVILADLIERPEEIDEAEIEKAKKRAEELRNKKDVDMRSLASAEADMNLALSRSKLLIHRKKPQV
jgi:F-type H+-transporting ATPase subunit epsilon